MLRFQLKKKPLSVAVNTSMGQAHELRVPADVSTTRIHSSIRRLKNIASLYVRKMSLSLPSSLLSLLLSLWLWLSVVVVAVFPGHYYSVDHGNSASFIILNLFAVAPPPPCLSVQAYGCSIQHFPKSISELQHLSLIDLHNNTMKMVRCVVSSSIFETALFVAVVCLLTSSRRNALL